MGRRLVRIVTALWSDALAPLAIRDDKPALQDYLLPRDITLILRLAVSHQLNDE
jgi:hypothetical protein